MNTNKSHILYIDDEPENLSGFKYVFKKTYTVHIAQSAEEGWKLLHQHPIKVIISDQRMPKTTGVQLLEKAAEEFPQIFRIILTGYTEVQDIIAAINKGKIFQFIRKPWEKDEVKVIIDNAIQLFDLKDENKNLLNSIQNKNKELEKSNETLESKVNERTLELESHKNNLEYIVKQRTRELEEAKNKAEESDRLKSAFLANVSHEIRTPMNAIIGFSELLVSGEIIDENDQEEFKEQIVLNSASLLRLIDDIIDISKIEANQISIEYDSYNLSQILYELQAIFNEQKATLQKDNVELIVDIPQNQDLIILTDKIRLHQILSNLIGNAFKFTDDGHIKFGYKLINSEQLQPMLRFFVEDTGIGISREAQTYIFERFRKAEVDNKVFRGTGLGLFICKNLIDKFEGKVWIESEPEKGATFHFDIPYKPGKQDLTKIKEQHLKATEVSYNFTDKVILVAEDEDSSYTFIENIMKDTQAKIIRARNGLEAIEILNTEGNNIDAILMDIQMPEMDGYKAISIIKKENSNIPIIAQTAYALVNQRQDVLDSGCDDFLAKPFQKNELLSALGKFLLPKKESSCI